MGYDTENQAIIPDARNLKGVCTAKNLSWSWTSCAIKAGCKTFKGNRRNAGTDYDLVGNPADDGATRINPGGGIKFTLDASIANLESINTSIVNYRPSLYSEGYLIFQNNSGSQWTYTSLRSISS